MRRVIRVIEIFGPDQWVEQTLARSIGPDGLLFHEKGIRELSRCEVVDPLPSQPITVGPTKRTDETAMYTNQE